MKFNLEQKKRLTTLDLCSPFDGIYIQLTFEKTTKTSACINIPLYQTSEYFNMAVVMISNKANKKTTTFTYYHKITLKISLLYVKIIKMTFLLFLLIYYVLELVFQFWF